MRCKEPQCKTPDGHPWILTRNKEGQDVADKCPIAKAFEVERQIDRMVSAPGDIPFDQKPKIKKFHDIEYNINDIQGNVKSIKKWMVSGKKGLYLYANNGTGKTTILLSILFELLMKDARAYYITSERLKELWIKESNGTINELDEARLSSFNYAHIRLIDELGAEGVSPFVETQFFKLLNLHGPRMILASNRLPVTEYVEPGSESEFHLQFQTEAIHSRLAEFQIEKWVMEDYRKLKEAK